MKNTKNLFFTISFLSILLVYTASCQKNESINTSNDDLIMKIANDQDYIAYREIALEKAKHITQSKFDLEKIREATLELQHNPSTQNENMCTISDTFFQEIKGGLLYKDLSCKFFTLSNKLEKKYPGIWQLDDNSLAKIRAIYKENHSKKYKELSDSYYQSYKK